MHSGAAPRLLRLPLLPLRRTVHRAVGRTAPGNQSRDDVQPPGALQRGGPARRRLDWPRRLRLVNKAKQKKKIYFRLRIGERGDRARNTGWDTWRAHCPRIAKLEEI